MTTLKTLSQQFGRSFKLLYLFSFLLITACDETNTGFDLLQTKHALNIACSISVGGGGETETINLFENQPSVLLVNTTSAWDFIRETSGPCHFTVYNEVNAGGRYVNLGTNLDGRIRAGEDGLRYKDDGGGETWRIRSVRIVRFVNTAPLNSFISIGGGGIRMRYYPGSYPRTPAMDRMTYFVGGNSDAILWNQKAYGALDDSNRFIAISPNATTVAEGRTREILDPGFRVRSLKITHWGNNLCDENSPNFDFGRCLPIYTLQESIYTTPGTTQDQDHDGLVDILENELTNAFRPYVVNHSTENATVVDTYTTVDGVSVSEPVVAFQVRKSSVEDGAIELVLMKLWKDDIGCNDHTGDSQKTKIHLRTPQGTNDTGKLWWLYSIDGGHAHCNATSIASTTGNAPLFNDEIFMHETIEEQEEREKQEIIISGLPFSYNNNSDLELYYSDRYIEPTADEKDADKTHAIRTIELPDDNIEFKWCHGNTFLRKPHFEKSGTESIPMHPVIYFSKGKHHEFQDAAYSGKNDPQSKLLGCYAYINSRGEQRVPPLPKRLLELCSPAGAGDQYDYNNVGSKDYFFGFMNSLTDFGFSGKKIWTNAKFYKADPACRSFNCSNNINKDCEFQDAL